MAKSKMQGILLIGMPYVGKSTIGRKIAKELGFKFFDGDEEIEKIIPERQEYLDKVGDEKYVEMEAKVITKLPIKNSVLAPGGSIIYSYKSKKYLKGCFKVYLNAPLSTIKKRITAIDKRGIVKLKRLGLAALYSERKEMFKSYSDIILDADVKSAEELSQIIIKAYTFHKLLKKKSNIKYISTNGKSQATFSEALKLGLAPDKGLFVPDITHFFSNDEIKLMSHLDYAQLAFVIVRQFVDIDDKYLEDMCKKAYKFGIPIENYGNIRVVRLDQGPSLSFKDFAIQLLAQMLTNLMKKEKKMITILTATSGDTGGAVASAFSGIKNIKAIILMPEKEITNVQRRQMTTAGNNITAVLVNGKFDDCQALAKKAFAQIKGLSSANSINIGRLLPQIVYYFYVYSRTNADTFVVPSGNFGNLVAGVMAKKMGLPIKLIAAVNENNEVPVFMKTGIYKPVTPSRKCISNAMNVGNPSNFARLLWFYNGIITETGQVKKMPEMKKLKKDIISVSITDKETTDAMRKAYRGGIILEPHGAVGWAALEKLKRKSNLGKIALFETAHPAKFPKELDALKIPYEIPPKLLESKNLTERYFKINPDLKELKKIINKS